MHTYIIVNTSYEGIRVEFERKKQDTIGVPTFFAITKTLLWLTRKMLVLTISVYIN